MLSQQDIWPKYIRVSEYINMQARWRHHERHPQGLPHPHCQNLSHSVRRSRFVAAFWSLSQVTISDQAINDFILAGGRVNFQRWMIIKLTYIHIYIYITYMCVCDLYIYIDIAIKIIHIIIYNIHRGKWESMQVMWPCWYLGALKSQWKNSGNISTISLQSIAHSD